MNKDIRFCQKITVWLALFAMLCHALLPALAQAGNDARANPTSLAQPFAEICTSTGVTLVALDSALSGKSLPPPMGKSQHQHCPYCLAGSDDVFLPPILGADIPFFATNTSTLLLTRPAPLYASRLFTSAAPRGPPSATFHC